MHNSKILPKLHNFSFYLFICHTNRTYPSTDGDGGKSGPEKRKILEYLLRVYVHRGL